MSSSVIAILKVPSTITTTLAPTSSERILEVTVEGAVSPVLFAALALSPPSDIADQLVHSVGLTRQFDFPSQPNEVLLQRLRRSQHVGRALEDDPVLI